MPLVTKSMDANLNSKYNCNVDKSQRPTELSRIHIQPSRVMR